MKERPSAVTHMILWGIGSGFILALSYIVVFIDLAGGVNAFALLFHLSIWVGAFILGAIPGAVMGIFLGLHLDSTLANIPLPFIKVDMNEKRFAVYIKTFALTIFLSSWLIFSFFGSLIDNYLADTLLDTIFFISIPSIIAAIASTYAAHRYMYRLCLWSGGAASRKSKAKNEALSAARLIEKNTERDDLPHSDSISAERQDYLP